MFLSAAEKGVLSKGVLAEIACNVILPLLGRAQMLCESSARRCLFKDFGWCDNGPQGAKILNCRSGMRGVHCEGGLQCTLQGSAENWQPISDIFRTPCFTVFDVQNARNTISDNFRILPKTFPEISALQGPF